MPDGRSIPVPLKGHGSRGSQPVSVTIHYHNTGTPQRIDIRGAIIENRELILQIWSEDFDNDGRTRQSVRREVNVA